jgi:hypothetical protein
VFKFSVVFNNIIIRDDKARAIVFNIAI